MSMKGAAKLDDRLDEEELDEVAADDSGEESESEPDDAGEFYQTKADILYEADDNQSYELASKSTEFLLVSRVFLEEELVKLLAHHQIQLNQDESAERIAKEAFELAEEMNAKKMWPAKLGVKAALRIALKKIVYFKYRKVFELSGMAKIRMKRKLPSVGEQIARNKALIGVWNAAKEDAGLRSTVMDLARNSLKMELLPEAFNRNARGDITAEQINDLTVNWLFSRISLHAGINEKHKVLLVLTLCKAFDHQSLYAEYARAFDLEEGSAELKQEVDQLSAELRAVFAEVTDTDFQNFLRIQRIDGRESGHRAGVEIGMDTRASSRPLDAYLRDLRGEIRTDKIENNPKGVALRYIELAKAKSGDFTARNNFVRSILRLSVSMVKKMRGNLADNIAQANMILLEKVVGYDLRYGHSIGNYAGGWMSQSVNRMRQEDRDVRIPVHMVEFVERFERFLWKNPELDRSKALDVFGADHSVPGNIKKMKEAAFLTTSNSMDKPIAEGENSTFGDLIADKSEMARFGEIVERVELRDKVEMAIDCLPPLCGVVIRLRMGMIPGNNGEKFNLTEIGELLGVSRERIRQIEALILYSLKSGSMKSMSGLSYYLRDEKMFEVKMAELGLGGWQADTVRMGMGLDAGKFYRKQDFAVVAMELEKVYGIKISEREVKAAYSRARSYIDQCPEGFGLSVFSGAKALKYCGTILGSLYMDRPISAPFLKEAQAHLKLLEGAMQRIDWNKIVAEKVDHEEVQEAKPNSKTQKKPRKVEQNKIVGPELGFEEEVLPKKNEVQAPDLIRTEMFSKTSEVLAFLDAQHVPIANAILAGQSPREIANDLQVPLGKVMMISARVKILIANNSK